jgi:riboflavin biosynthesis pyrimidine reductase
VEGGAATVSAFLAAGALDRFHLSIAPMVIGSGPVGLNLPPIDELAGALRPTTFTHHLGEDVVFDCDFRAK